MTPREATLDWLGCATFRLRVGRLTVFLDAYIDRVRSAPAVGMTTADVQEADWILIGHSHFDHLWGADRIARRTGAKIVATYETMRVLLAQGVPREQVIPVSGGERIRLNEDVSVRVYPSLHSCAWAHREPPGTADVCLGDFDLFLDEQQDRFADLLEWVGSLGPVVTEHLRACDQGAEGDGGSLVFVIETPSGQLFFQDTSGCWSAVLGSVIPSPDVAILAAGGRANLDGHPVQGTLAEFVAEQARLLQAGRVILSHHDDWLPGFSRAIEVEPIRRALGRVAPDSELIELPYLSDYSLFD